MLLALRQLLWQGGLRVGITVVTALSIAGMLSLVAKHQEPRKSLVAEAAAAKGCLPSHCRPKVKPQQLYLEEGEGGRREERDTL